MYQPQLKSQQDFFATGKTRSIEFRKHQVRNLGRILNRYEAPLLRALKEDLGKPFLESYMGELAVLKIEIKHAIKHLRAWSLPKKVSVPAHQWPAQAWIHREPYGQCLIIAPWNYPVQLLLSPAIGAMAAGNTICLKPSELTPATAELLANMLKDNFAEEYLCVFPGGVEVSQNLLDLPFNHIFFSGSSRVGKIVMQKASQHLTPVTLELGGKSPCIVDRKLNLRVSARRIVWGKFFNAGQTCVAPDYLLVHKSIQEPLIKEMETAVRHFYGQDIGKSPDYARVINKQHFDRLVSYLKDGTIRFGGAYSKDDLFIEPTFLTDTPLTSAVMSEEIFGPILPIVPFETHRQAMDIIENNPKPLAFYLFSTDSQVQKTYTRQLNFGGGCLNDTLVHLTLPELPFGGVGPSGMGRYHGYRSYECFTYEKSLLKKSFLIDPPLRYAPYINKFKWVKRFFA